jgi:hypothetical protein
MSSKLQSILEAEGFSFLLDKFTAEGFTDSVLSDLSDSDLQQLGIDKLGERRRLLAAFGKPIAPSGWQKARKIFDGLLKCADDIGNALDISGCPIGFIK